MACTTYIYDDKVGPETSPTACNCPVQLIYEYMMKKVPPETSPTDYTWSVQNVFMMEKFVRKLPL
jgi:hypothetical protein